jgi:hypothetical protein
MKVFTDINIQGDSKMGNFDQRSKEEQLKKQREQGLGKEKGGQYPGHGTEKDKEGIKKPEKDRGF